MNWFRHVIAGLKTLFRLEREDQDVADEVQHFMDEAVRELVGRGVPLREARRQVHMRYGDGRAVREEVRASGWEHGIEVLLADLRLSLRRLIRMPAFTMVAVATLGVGIGAATAVFSAVGPVLFASLPYPQPEALLSIADRSTSGDPVPVTFGTFTELRERADAFEAVAVVKGWQPTLTEGLEPERLEGESVSAAYLDVLGVPPAMGPGFSAAEDAPSGALQVVVSDAFFRRRMEAERSPIGTALLLDGQSYQVVGVMPPSFRSVTAPAAEIWTLLQYDPAGLADFNTREWGHHLEMVARVGAGGSAEAAREALSRIAASPMPGLARPEWASMQDGFVIRGLKEATTADLRGMSVILLIAVGLLLLVTCTNLTVLLLARAVRRRGEFAMRMALGAGRGRLLRYLATESILLALVGGAAGAVVARLGLTALMQLAPGALAQSVGGAVDSRALVASASIAALVGLVFGLVPATAGGGGRLMGAVRQGGLGIAGGHWRARRALVVTEVALAVALLIGAGLLLRTTHRLLSSSPGFSSDQVAVFQIHGTSLASGDAAVHAFFDEALEAVRELPGVSSAAFTSQLPLSGDHDAYGATPADQPPNVDDEGPVFRYAVSPDYLTTMGIPIVQGTPLVVEGGASAVISESLAQRLFGNEDPIGRGVNFGAGQNVFTVAGVARDVRQPSLASDQMSGMYILSHDWQWADRVRWMVVRSDRPLQELAPRLREAIWSVNRSQPIVRTQTLEALVGRSEGQRRFVQGLLMAFAAAALLLAGIGLFGVLAGNVAARTREVGIRMALGATQTGILQMVVRQGLGLTAIGTVIGVAASLAGTRLLGSLLVGVSRTDPVTYLAVTVTMGLVAGLACWIPARRAATGDALTALRSDEG